MKINYIVATYFGPRRSYPGDYGTMFFDSQLAFLKLIGKNSKIHQATFVVNGPADKEMLEKKILDADLYVPVEVIYRDNVGYSYAAWEEALKLYCGKGLFDYHFLNEDDYFPTSTGFYIPFLDEFDDATGFVCLKKSWPGFMGHQVHPTMSIGLISDFVSQASLSTNGAILDVHTANDTYTEAEESQIHMMDNFAKIGYGFKGVSETYSKPFFDNSMGVLERATDPVRSPLLLPIGVDLNSIRPGLQ